MKKLIVLLLTLCSFTAIHAQDEYTDAMSKTLTKMKEAKEKDELQECANIFERIANMNTDRWEAPYYAALANISQIWQTKDGKQIDALADKADEWITKAEAISKDNSEIVTLKAMSTSGRIMADPQGRGMKYGMQAAMLTDQAIKLDPTNPRPVMQKAYSKLYTPAAFGGGKDKAKKYFEEAQKLFENFKPQNVLSPIWGADQIKMGMEQTK